MTAGQCKVRRQAGGLFLTGLGGGRTVPDNQFSGGGASMSRVSRKWVLVLLVLLVWVAGEVGLEALKDKGPTTQGLNPVKNKFTATANPGPGLAPQGTNGPALRGNSTEVVANLNADQLDGQHSAAFAAAVHGHNVADISGAGTLGGNSCAGDQTA